jgi:hypothetical protein
MQESIARVEPAAELLKQLYPKAEKLRLSCEKLLQANQKWPVDFQVVLRNATGALENLLRAKGLEARIRVLEERLASERRAVEANVVALNDRSASLEAELASARKVRDLLK